MNFSKTKLALLVSLLFVIHQGFSAEEDSLSYREGYGLVLEEEWLRARDYFTQFLSDWPESVWADDAAFWNCYSIEKAGNRESDYLNCYQQFVSNWPESSWTEDAMSKLAVLGTRMENFDFLADTLESIGVVDVENMSEMIEQAMAEAERELERVQVQVEQLEIGRPGIRMPELPDLPDAIELREQMREQLEDVRIEVQRQRSIQVRRRLHNSADDELLSIIGALRGNERASDLLIRRLDTSSNPAMRQRIVLLLEGLEGDNVTSTLINVISNDESDAVRNDAILVLLDRGDPSSRELLLEIVADPSYAAAIRAEIVGEIEDWGEDQAIDVLSELLLNESDPTMIIETADALSDIGSEAAIQALTGLYEESANAEIRHQVLRQLADIETLEVINYLTNIALSDTDDALAVVAIKGIASREDDFAVAALDQIYNNSGSLQRQLVAIEGIGDAEIEQAAETLEGLLVNAPSPQIIAAIASALGATGQRGAVASVLGIYHNSEDETVQRAVITALRDLDEFDEAIDALLEILEDRLSGDEIE